MKETPRNKQIGNADVETKRGRTNADEVKTSTFFFPHTGISVEAETQAEADEKHAALINKN